MLTLQKGMEELIKQAFLHVDIIGPHVHEGHYDLIGPDGEIILPQVWETMIQPDWAITMHMWPMPDSQPVQPPTSKVEYPTPPPPPPPPPSSAPPSTAIARANIIEQTAHENVTDVDLPSPVITPSHNKKRQQKSTMVAPEPLVLEDKLPAH